jgi:uncharacterized alkaline shock family protein YloU
MKNSQMEKNGLGTVEVAPAAIASLASQAVVECYGVVGMATKDLASGIVQVLQPSKNPRGVDIQLEDDRITINLYVVVEYGTRIATVAQNIQNSVKYTVEKALGVPVAAVNVHVEDLRVSTD